MHVFTFLLSAVAFLLLAFALHLLFTKQGNPLLNRLLSIPLFARFGQVCVFLLIVTAYRYVFPSFQQLSIPLFFAAPACSYLYVKYFIGGQTFFKRRDFLHFIPVIFGFIHLLPFGEVVNWNGVAEQILAGGQLSSNLPTGLFSPQIYNAMLSVLILGYLVAMWYTAFSSGFMRRKWDINKTWLCFYMGTSSFFKLLGFVALIFNVMKRSYLASPSFLIISCAVLLFMMCFVLYQPRILYGYFVLSGSNGTMQRGVKINGQKKVLSAKTDLDDQQQQLMAIIQQLMENEQPFLQPDFQMKDLAKMVDIPTHHCSLVINVATGKNFRDWLNSYRIQYFIYKYQALADKMTVEAVAQQSGFRNVTTFYNAFKKETGQIPKAYFEG